MHKSIGKCENQPPPREIVTPEHFILKLCTRDDVGEVTRDANVDFNRYSTASPQIGEILKLCDFFDCPVLFLPFYLDPTPKSNRLTYFHRFSRFMAHTTCFRARMVLFWGLERQGNMPPKLSTNDYPNEIQYGCRRSS